MYMNNINVICHLILKYKIIVGIIGICIILKDRNNNYNSIIFI